MQVDPSAVGGGATIRAAVEDPRLAGDDATSGSPYVLFMLGSGEFDDRPHVDARADERQLGIAHGDDVSIRPEPGLGERSTSLIESGEYSPSVDGTITYRDIPRGTHQLRALVLDSEGSWDGTLASRTIEVP